MAIITPTVDQVREAAGRMGGRPDAVIDEVIRLGKACLNLVLADVNADPLCNRSFPQVNSFYVAGQKIESDYPVAIVSASSRFSVQGGQGAKADTTVEIAVVYSTKADHVQVINAFGIAQWYGTILHACCGSHSDPDGRPLWNQALVGDLSLFHTEETPGRSGMLGASFNVVISQPRGDYWRKTT